MSARMVNLIAVPISCVVAVSIFQTAFNSVVASPVAGIAIVINELVVEDPVDILSQATPQQFSVHGDWTDWETWEASPDILEAFPDHKVGHDLDGLAVYLIEFGKWDYREWAHKPEEKQKEFWKYFEQFIKRQGKDAGANNGEGIVQLVDWDGFSLSHHASPKAIKLAMKMFAGLMRVDGFMKYGFYVNVNFAAETFINAMRPFLGPFLEKFEICGTRMEKCKPSILKNIGADQLTPKYGGSSSH